VPHSFAFFANEWVSANKRDARTRPLTKPLDRTGLDPHRPLLKFHPYQSGLSEKIRRVAQLLILLSQLARGAPSFAHFLRRVGVGIFTRWTNTCRIDSIASRPCKGRKDGAPPSCIIGEETKTER